MDSKLADLVQFLSEHTEVKNIYPEHLLYEDLGIDVTDEDLQESFFETFEVELVFEGESVADLLKIVVSDIPEE